MLPGFFLDTVGSGIREQQREAMRRAEKDNDYELEILKTLALHGSDEIKGLAGAAWLDLANNPVSKRPRAGGIKGFLGEVQKSPHLQDVQTAIRSARTAQQPTNASMSTNAPVEPGSRPIAQAPPEPSSVGPAFGQTLDPSGQLAAVGPGPEGPPMRGPQEPLQSTQNVVGGMLPQAPPEPEIRSLFPTAEEIAKQKVAEQSMLLQGKLDTTAAAIQRYGGTPEQVQDAMLGMAGAPRRRVNSIPMMLTVDGREVAGSYDPDTDTYEVAGRPVQPTAARRMSTSQPSSPRPQLRVGADGEYTWIYPPTPSEPAPTRPPQAGVPPAPGQPDLTVTSAGTGVKRPPPQPSPNPPMSTFTGDPDGPGPQEMGTYARNPDGSVGRKLGTPPPRAGMKTDEQRKYEVWLKQVDENLRALGKNMLGRTRPLTQQQRDNEAAKVTGIPGMTYNDLSLGAKGGQIPERGGKSGVSRDEFRDFLNQFSRQFAPPPAGSTVEGGTTIPAAPPPPRR